MTQLIMSWVLRASRRVQGSHPLACRLSRLKTTPGATEVMMHFMLTLTVLVLLSQAVPGNVDLPGEGRGGEGLSVRALQGLGGRAGRWQWALPLIWGSGKSPQVLGSTLPHLY